MKSTQGDPASRSMLLRPRIGDLYQYNKDLSLRFCEVKNGLIKDDRDWSQRSVIAKGDVVMFIERLAYTEKTGARPGAAVIVAVTAAADWDKVYDLWKNNQNIPGGIYLHPNGKLIWISDIDLKYFKQIETK